MTQERTHRIVRTAHGKGGQPHRSPLASVESKH